MLAGVGQFIPKVNVTTAIYIPFAGTATGNSLETLSGNRIFGFPKALEMLP